MKLPERDDSIEKPIIQMIRGQKVKISELTPSLHIEVGINVSYAGPGSVDITCIGVDSENKLSDDRYFVFYNQTTSAHGEIRMLGTGDGDTERFDIDLFQIPANIVRLVFTAAIDGDGTMAQLSSGYIRLQSQGREVARFPFTGDIFTNEKAIIIAEFYLKDKWRFAAVGQGFNGGLSALLEHFGDEQSQEPARTQSAPAPKTEEYMSRYSVSDFVSRTAQKDLNQGVFELESKHMLEINLNGKVWTKTGSMVANLGNVKFIREGMLEHGLGKMLKKAMTGEGTQLTKVEGAGKIYVADNGKEVTILNLNNESVCVNGHDVLAFEDSIEWDIKFTKRIAGMLSGGLFHVVLKGTGMVAFTTHYEPLTLKVTPSMPVCTDPNATVAWSSNLEPELKTDINIRTFIGRGSGEAFQMVFRGDGFVVIQPYEEVYYSSTGG